jgi:hypothetical protein
MGKPDFVINIIFNKFFLLPTLHFSCTRGAEKHTGKVVHII